MEITSSLKNNILTETNQIQKQDKTSKEELEPVTEIQAEREAKEEDVKKVINDFNELLEPAHISSKYVYHEKLEEYYVTLINDQTKEVVKEIPAKRLLDLHASMKEYLGLFVDKKA